MNFKTALLRKDHAGYVDEDAAWDFFNEYDEALKVVEQCLAAMKADAEDDLKWTIEEEGYQGWAEKREEQIKGYEATLKFLKEEHQFVSETLEYGI